MGVTFPPTVFLSGKLWNPGLHGESQSGECLARGCSPKKFKTGRHPGGGGQNPAKMTGVSCDLAEMISMAWMGLESRHPHPHLSVGRLSQQSHEVSVKVPGGSQDQCRLNLSSMHWRQSLMAHVETSLYLFYCAWFYFPPLSRVKMSWISSTPERKERLLKDGKNKTGRASSLGAPLDWMSGETDTSTLDAKLSGEET